MPPKKDQPKKEVKKEEVKKEVFKVKNVPAKIERGKFKITFD